MKTTATHTKHYSYLLACILFSTSYLFAGNPTKPIAPLLKAKADAWMEQTKQLGFQENNGQIVDTDGKQTNNVLYKAEAPGINIWVTTSGLTYQFLKFEEEKKESKAKKEESELANPIAIDDNMKVTWH